MKMSTFGFLFFPRGFTRAMKPVRSQMGTPDGWFAFDRERDSNVAGGNLVVKFSKSEL